MLIVCGKLDKKDLSAAWLQAIYANSGGLVTLTGDINEARTWGMHVLSMANISIDNTTLDALVHLNQNNYAQFQQDLNKLCFLYPAGHNIMHDEVLEQLTDNAQFNVFALSSIYLQGNLSQAIKVFQNVCHETEDAILVVWSLSEDVRKLIQIKSSLRVNPNFSSAIGSLRIWGDAIGAFQAANKRLSYVKLLSLLNEIAIVDTIIKGLVVGDAIFKLEQIIIDFCKEG
jgi:DNA polymerase-3 subunit delta